MKNDNHVWLLLLVAWELSFKHMVNEKQPPEIAGPWCVEHQKDIERMMHDLYGNGREGMLRRFERIEDGFRFFGRAFIIAMVVMAPLILNSISIFFTFITKILQHVVVN